MGGFRSRFGGLWIDGTDAALVQARLAAIASARLRGLIAAFIRDGYVILEGAVSHQAIDAYLAQYEQAADRTDFLQIDVPMEGGRQAFGRDKALRPGSKILDSAMLLSRGGDLSFASEISEFLTALFEEAALAFQTLHFEVGSTQAIHQDTAYVVVDREPMKLAASWIALEDVRPGSGELIYYPGGHRMMEHVYQDGVSKHWDPARDGHPVHDAHLVYLREEAARLGLRQAHFLPRKGDALIWHADLPHGGGAITRPGVTRRSLVTHYCPISRDPYYMQSVPQEWRRKVPARNGHAFCSLYFTPDRFGSIAG